MSEFVEFMDDLKESDDQEVHERGFELFDISLSKAVNEFLKDMRDLKLIMNCRVKGDDNAHFGGEECARFMTKIMDACAVYLRTSKFLDGNREGDLGYVIRGIREKARKDRAHAIDFEKSARTLYLSEGVDKTEEIFRESGYFNSDKEFRNIRDFAKSKTVPKNLS
ncbi:MAG: hypothetical protein IKE41_03490 [Clostridia bacterium]|nr:hypothetical protein [Clostridia bacterium]